MPRPSNNDIEQDKLARFDRIKKAIAQLEKQQRQILKQGELAPEAAWVARYQVRQNIKRYWYYKLQVPHPYFKSATSEKLSNTKSGCQSPFIIKKRTIWSQGCQRKHI